MTSHDLGKSTFDGAKIFEFNTRSEVPDRREVAIAAFGTKVANSQRLFEVKTATHQLAIDGFDGFRRQWAGVQTGDFLEHRGFTMRCVDGNPGLPLELADFDNQFGPVVQQAHELAIDLINFPTDVGEDFLVHGGRLFFVVGHALAI